MSIFSKYAERNIKKFIAKKGAILWAVGFIVKHSPSKEDDKMFAKIKKALD